MAELHVVLTASGYFFIRDEAVVVGQRCPLSLLEVFGLVRWDHDVATQPTSKIAIT